MATFFGWVFVIIGILCIFPLYIHLQDPAPSSQENKNFALMSLTMIGCFVIASWLL